MSKAAKEDMAIRPRLLKLTLLVNNSVATSYYKFNKRHDKCLLPFKHIELCLTFHKKVEKDLCINSDCGDEGVKVEPLRFCSTYNTTDLKTASRLEQNVKFTLMESPKLDVLYRVKTVKITVTSPKLLTGLICSLISSTLQASNIHKVT